MSRRDFTLTTHAASVIAKRRIEIDWIGRVLAKPERTETDRWDSALTHALGPIEERGARILRVVYNDSMKPPRVITAYFDRRQRGKS